MGWIGENNITPFPVTRPAPKRVVTMSLDEFRRQMAFYCAEMELGGEPDFVARLTLSAFIAWLERKERERQSVT